MADTVTDLALAAIAAHETARSEYPQNLLQLHAELSSVFPVVRREEIERNGLRGTFSSGRRFLYLPPVKDNVMWLPLASIHLPHNSAISFQVALFAGTSIYEKVYAIRFESPEGDAAGATYGIHNFFHAQFCQVLRPHGDAVSTIDWLPVTQPAFPLDATNDESLVAAMLVTLYGASFLTNIRQALGELPKSIQEMQIVQLQPTYFRVTSAGGDVHLIKGVEADRATITERARHRFNSRAIVPATRSEYTTAPTNQKRWAWIENAFRET